MLMVDTGVQRLKIRKRDIYLVARRLSEAQISSSLSSLPNVALLTNMAPATLHVALILLVAVQVSSGLRFKRSAIEAELETASSSLKDKLSSKYASSTFGIDDALAAIDKANEFAKADGNDEALMEYVKALEKARQVVDQIAQPDNNGKVDMKTMQDVAAGVGAIAQVTLMATIPPPLGAAFGVLAGTLGGLFGRGGTMRLSTVVDDLLVKRLKEARFEELADKMAGGRKELETVYVALKGMMTVPPEKWKDEDRNNVGAQAKIFAKVDLMGEVESHLTRVRADSDQVNEFLSLIDAYAQVYYIRTMMLSMMLQIYNIHEMEASAAGVYHTIDHEKKSVRTYFAFFENPSEQEGTRILNLDPVKQKPIFTFANVIGLDIDKWQKTLVGKCFHIHNKYWPNYYWAVNDYGTSVKVTDEDYSVPGDKAKIEVVQGSKPGYVSLKPKAPGTPIGTAKINQYTQGGGLKIKVWTPNIVVETGNQQVMQRNNNWRLAKLNNDFWYIKPESFDTPVYIPSGQHSLGWTYNEPGEGGMFEFKEC